MCRNWFLDFCSFKIVFKVICALLTLFLICQELFTFVVEKPSTTSREEKDIDINDIPEVVICLEPGFDTKVLEKYGYNDVGLYYKGIVDGEFVGWNGNKNKTKPSIDILEEALIVQNQHISGKKFITSAKYRTTESLQLEEIEVNLRTLVWPFGRCFSVKPYAIQGNVDSAVNTLYLAFNETVFKAYKDMHVSLYFMDKTSSIKIYPDENDMAGNPLKVRIDRKCVSKYKTKISRSYNIQGDPSLNCDEYTPEKSYNDCIQEELFGSFQNILSCHPPLLAQKPEKICDGKFNLSTNNWEEIKRILTGLNSHNNFFKCKRPCQTNIYTSRLMSTIPNSHTGISVIFDRTISVTRSEFTINGQTFLIRLGGSVSSGRTLLWILVTFLGVPQVREVPF